MPIDPQKLRDLEKQNQSGFVRREQELSVNWNRNINLAPTLAPKLAPTLAQTLAPTFAQTLAPTFAPNLNLYYILFILFIIILLLYLWFFVINKNQN
jgi:hypothetical protein